MANANKITVINNWTKEIIHKFRNMSLHSGDSGSYTGEKPFRVINVTNHFGEHFFSHCTPQMHWIWGVEIVNDFYFSKMIVAFAFISEF